jgi:hypothetical protein
MWNSTSPTTTTFSIGTHPNVNTSSNNYIAYCFTPVKGYSAMGSYVGNGSSDGTYVHLGFSPAFIMLKDTSTAYDWMIFDNKRNGFNPDNDDLEPSNNSAESNTNKLDILSSGFKLRKADADANASGDTFIYMAFSDQSIVSSNGVPAVAR